jgi:hypothetical protein
MLVCDFFHVDCAVTLQRLYCFFVIEIGSRHYNGRRSTVAASCTRRARTTLWLT